MIYPEVLPDIVSRLRKEDLQIFRSCWYLRIDNFVIQDISLGYFQKKIFWYTCIVWFLPLHRVFYRRTCAMISLTNPV